MCSRAAARWRLPSSTTVRNERICASMPKTDADRRSPQSVLGIIRLRVGVLPWMPSRKNHQQQPIKKYIMTTALEATDKDFEQMMQMLTGFFVTQIAGAVATFSIADHLANGPATAQQIATTEGIHSTATFRLLRA